MEHHVHQQPIAYDEQKHAHRLTLLPPIGQSNPIANVDDGKGETGHGAHEKGAQQMRKVVDKPKYRLQTHVGHIGLAEVVVVEQGSEAQAGVVIACGQAISGKW
jgi:hypothetical protein